MQRGGSAPSYTHVCTRDARLSRRIAQTTRVGEGWGEKYWCTFRPPALVFIPIEHKRSITKYIRTHKRDMYNIIIILFTLGHKLSDTKAIGSFEHVYFTEVFALFGRQLCCSCWKIQNYTRHFLTYVFLRLVYIKIIGENIFV